MKKQILFQFLFSGFVFLFFLSYSNFAIAQTETASFYNVNAATGNGLRFWSSNSYKIHMGNTNEYHYGPVTDYSIKTNMNATAGRGWTWGITGQTPVTALNNVGHFQTKGYIRSMDRNFYFGSTQRLYGDNDAALRYFSNHSTVTHQSFYDKEGTRYGYVYGGGNGAYFGLLDGDGNWSYLAAKDNYTAFRINDDEKMRIKNDGNVGIGTSTPQAKLHIFGGTDVSLASGGNLILGATSHDNIAIDNNEIQARNNGNASKLYIQHEGGDAIIAKGGGKVGIGTSTPQAKLHIYGGVDANLASGGHLILGATGQENIVIDNNEMQARNNGNASKLYIQHEGGDAIIAKGGGKVGIGTSAPKGLLQLGQQLVITSPNTNGAWGGISKNMYWDSGIKRIVNDEGAEITFNDTGDIIFRSSPAGAAGSTINTVNHNMTIKNGGGVNVCGTLTANEIIVQANTWCDYVFEEDYNLPSLEEEKAHIESKGHLIGFESEAEMDGQIQMGDVTLRQQQKIEELVLHSIELNEKVKTLEAQNKALAKVIADIQAQMKQ